jgi:polyhydroxyalkanoate synthesis regulator phasin
MARSSRREEAAEAVRGAVDRTFQATVGQAQVTRERAQELVDEVAGAAGRVREALDDLRPMTGEDMRALRDQLQALERRVAALEKSRSREEGRS